MTTHKQDAQNTNLGKRRGVSPILATVILLGVTVVGGGVTFALLSSGTQTASSQNIIAIENAQAIKGTDHADITATIKNAGTKPWVKLEMTVSKSELSEPLLYESLHENVSGCDAGTYSATACKDGEASVSGATSNRENPLRAQWIAHLDKTGGETNKADPGEGISVGRKYVFDNKDDYRTVTILNGTAVSPLFGGVDQDGNTALSTKMVNAGITACSPATDTDCTTQFDALDPISGNVFCSSSTDNTVTATCRVFTHTNIEDSPIAPGSSKYFYADAFTKEVPGLNNQVVRVGDALVVNLVAIDVDGGDTRAQTIIKVAGV